MDKDIHIYNEDCFVTMNRMKQNNIKCDVVLTSPPYNNSRTCRRGVIPGASPTVYPVNPLPGLVL